MHAKEFDINHTLGKEELKLIPNYKNLALSQLDITDLASTVKAAYSGHVVTYLHKPEERIGLRVMLDEKSKNMRSPLQSIYVKNSFDNLIPITRLVQVHEVKSPENIFHYNGDRTNRISANIDLSKTSQKKIYHELRQKYADFSKKNPGFSTSIVGEAKESSTTFSRIIVLLIFAIMAIYVVLILQFNSFTQPIMVILAIPFGIVGITLAFGFHNLPVSMLAMLGILGFSGVVINDSLIMVDYINKLRHVKKGQENLQEKIIEGALLRFRPILLTSITTIVGLVPTAYGFIGGMDSFISPMVFAVSWGLFIGTLAVLIVIPVFYLIIESRLSKKSLRK